MQIRINLKIFIFIIVFYFTRQIEIYGVLMLFALLHELGHLFAGIFLGFRPESLKVNPLGLSINFKIRVDDYNGKVKNGNVLALKKLIISLCGPLVNFLMMFIVLIFKINLFGIEREIVIYSNLLIALFNLIPIYPLDGGRIIKSFLHILFGLEKTYNYVNLISNISIITLTVFSSIIIVYLKNISILFIVVYLWYLIVKENKLNNQMVKIYEIINDTV